MAVGFALLSYLIREGLGRGFAAGTPHSSLAARLLENPNPGVAPAQQPRKNSIHQQIGARLSGTAVYPALIIASGNSRLRPFKSKGF